MASKVHKLTGAEITKALRDRSRCPTFRVSIFARSNIAFTGRRWASKGSTAWYRVRIPSDVPARELAKEDFNEYDTPTLVNSEGTEMFLEGLTIEELHEAFATYDKVYKASYSISMNFSAAYCRELLTLEISRRQAEKVALSNLKSVKSLLSNLRKDIQ